MTLSVEGGGGAPVAGTNDLVRMYAATKSFMLTSGWGVLPVTISNAAHTITAIQPLVRFVALSATRVATLPASSALRNGQCVEVTVDSTGAAGVNVAIPAAGA